MAFGLWGLCDGIWYKVKEYHHDARKKNIQKSDEEYYEDLVEFANGLTNRIIVDPSASSFIILLKKKGWKVIRAKNDVLEGIRNVASALTSGLIKYCDVCKETFREYSHTFGMKKLYNAAKISRLNKTTTKWTLTGTLLIRFYSVKSKKKLFHPYTN